MTVFRRALGHKERKANADATDSAGIAHPSSQRPDNTGNLDSESVALPAVASSDMVRDRGGKSLGKSRHEGGKG